MRDRPCQLAIESTGRGGSIALGRGDTLLGSVTLPPPKRHRVELMPAVAELFGQHSVTPADLADVGLSIGPGSFTGLRIAVTTAKMFAATLGVRVLTADTADIVAEETPGPGISGAGSGTSGGPTGETSGGNRLAVLLNVKNGSAWRASYEHDGARWLLAGEAGLVEVEAFLKACPRPTRIVSSVELPGELLENLEVLPVARAQPAAATLWRLMRAGRCETVDPLTLSPIYAREPEAQEQWDRRYGPAATIQTRNEAKA